MKTLDSRLAKLEVKRAGPAVVVHCCAIGDNPPTRPDGSVCHQHHAKLFELGGDNWIRFVTVPNDDKHG